MDHHRPVVATDGIHRTNVCSTKIYSYSSTPPKRPLLRVCRYLKTHTIRATYKLTLLTFMSAFPHTLGFPFIWTCPCDTSNEHKYPVLVPILTSICYTLYLWPHWLWCTLPASVWRGRSRRFGRTPSASVWWRL